MTINVNLQSLYLLSSVLLETSSWKTIDLKTLTSYCSYDHFKKTVGLNTATTMEWLVNLKLSWRREINQTLDIEQSSVFFKIPGE